MVNRGCNVVVETERAKLKDSEVRSHVVRKWGPLSRAAGWLAALTELWHTQFMNICNPIQGFMQILLTQAGNMSLSSFQT